jgi:hypothetical protein
MTMDRSAFLPRTTGALGIATLAFSLQNVTTLSALVPAEATCDHARSVLMRASASRLESTPLRQPAPRSKTAAHAILVIRSL